MRKQFFTIAAVGMFLLLMIGCGDDDGGGVSLLGPAETETALSGSWIREIVNGVNYAGLMFDGGVYVYVNLPSEGGEPYAYREGTYAIDGTNLTLSAIDGCSGEGIYIVGITEDKSMMTLTRTSDDCGYRSGELPGDWTAIATD